MNKRPHLIAQNRRLSDRERQRGLAAIESVMPALDQREGYVRDHQLDPGFSLPDANWAHANPPIRLLARYARLLRQDPNNLDLLRFNVPMFTGFDLYLYAKYPEPSLDLWERRPPIIEWPFPDATEERLRARLDEQAHHVEHWLYLVNIGSLNAIASPPPICGEIGWEVKGVIVNHDTVAYQERLALMHVIGLFRFLHARIAASGTARILEIGGGYGALANYVKKVMPNVAYTICDLPESLLMSGTYLSLARPDLRTHMVSLTSPETGDLDAFHFLPNYVLPQMVQTLRYDLVINTLSLSEMSVAQIGRYGAMVSEMISGTGLFFEQNQDNRHIDLAYCKEHLPRYFLTRTAIDPPFEINQGKVDLWANHRVTIPLG